MQHQVVGIHPQGLKFFVEERSLWWHDFEIIITEVESC